MRAFRSLLAAAPFVFGTVASATTISVRQAASQPVLYEPFDLVLDVQSPAGSNPFVDASVTAVLQASGQPPLTLHGFCDAPDGTVFRVRFCPDAMGPLSWRVDYVDPAGTQSAQGTLTVGWGAGAGPIRVDSRFPSGFVESRTGRTWVHQGCTALPYFLASEDSERAFVDRMTANGFDRCRILLSGGMKSPFTDREVNPFVGTDVTRFDLRFWRKVERQLAYMRSRGMVADLIFEIEWGDLVYRFIDRNRVTDAEWRFVRYAVDRLSAFPNVTWNLGNEYNEYHTQSWAESLGSQLAAYDPYRHVVTVHPNQAVFAHAASPWASIVDLQAYAGGTAVTVRRDWAALRDAISAYLGAKKPVVDDEYGYESPYPPDVVRRTHWATVFAGGYATYGSFEALTVQGGDDRLAGGEIVDGQLRRLVDFLATTDVRVLRPDARRVTASTGVALARSIAGHESAIYLPDGGSATIDVSDFDGAAMPVEWIEPATGARLPAGTTSGTSPMTFVAPFSPDALLHVGGLIDSQPAWQPFMQTTALRDFDLRGGRWLVRGRVLGQAQPGGTLATATWRSRRFDDALVAFDLRFASGAASRAGIALRQVDPSAKLLATGLLVSLDRTGAVEVWEAASPKPRRVAAVRASTWNAADFNHVQTLVRGDRVGVTVNGDVVATGRLRGRSELGFATLYTYGGRAAFDSLGAQPIFYRNFDDGRLDGVLPVRGTLRADGAGLLQASPAGGAAGFATIVLADFTLEASLRTDPARGTNGAGLVLRAGARDDVSGTSGYYLRTDGRRHLELQRLSPSGTAVLASYDDPESGGVLQPAGWNRLVVTAEGAHFVVSVAGHAILDATDDASLWPAGYVVFRDGRGLTRLDDLAITPKP
jgi:uncharacterized protein DUF4038/uncharacterized protein DUF5060